MLMLAALAIWFVLAIAAFVGIATLLGGSVMLALRSWRIAGIVVISTGLVGAGAALAALAVLSLITSGTLKYTASEAWLVVSLAGFAVAGFPSGLMSTAVVVLNRRRHRGVASAEARRPA